MYEAKQILLYGDNDEYSEFSEDVLSRRSYYFGQSSGHGAMGRKSSPQHRKSIPKTSYGSRRASSNSLVTIGTNILNKYKKIARK